MPQGERTRVGVTARRVGAEHGPCNVLLVQDALGWLLYPHGDPQLAARMTEDDARTLSEGIHKAQRDRLG